MGTGTSADEAKFVREGKKSVRRLELIVRVLLVIAFIIFVLVLILVGS